jgi:hypothetical protein
MPRDLNIELDRAAGLVNDATNTLRGVAAGRLPAEHRRLTQSAARHLEAAEQDLFKARNAPWSSEAPRRPRQMSLGVG